MLPGTHLESDSASCSVALGPAATESCRALGVNADSQAPHSLLGQELWSAGPRDQHLKHTPMTLTHLEAPGPLEQWQSWWALDLE